MFNFRVVLKTIGFVLGVAFLALTATQAAIILPQPFSRPLEGTYDPKLKGATSLEHDAFYELVPESVFAASAMVIREERFGTPMRLSDSDRRTILQAALRYEDSSTSGAHQSKVIFNLGQYFDESANYNSENNPFSRLLKIHRILVLKFKEEYNESPNRRKRTWELTGGFPLWPRDPKMGEGVPLNLAAEMRPLITYFELIRRLENKLSSGPAIWGPLLEQAYVNLETWLLDFDRQLKIISQYDYESAQKLSSIAVATFLGSEDPVQEKIATRVFKTLREKAMLNVWANRYLTRSVSFVMTDVARPIREWTFNLMIFASAAGAYRLFGSDPAVTEFTDKLTSASHSLGHAWIGLLFFSGLNILPPLAARIGDELINTFSRLLAMDNKGPLANAYQYNQLGAAILCQEALRNSR